MNVVQVVNDPIRHFAVEGFDYLPQAFAQQRLSFCVAHRSEGLNPAACCAFCFMVLCWLRISDVMRDRDTEQIPRASFALSFRQAVYVE